MNRRTFIAADNVITSIGFDTKMNFRNIKSGKIGIKPGSYPQLSREDFPASLIDKEMLEDKAKALSLDSGLTTFEKLLVISITDVLNQSGLDIRNPLTKIILSTTKGNIGLLQNNPDRFPVVRIHLWKTAEIIGRYFNTYETPHIISNACISGIMALIAADRFIKSGKYENVVVAGCDILSEFIVSGFQSFLSLSKDACSPFDINRTGLSLGEGAAAVVLTSNESICPSPLIEVVKGAGSNDANHISGPSQTGDGLFIAISEVLQENSNIDYISAHGTATPYNDDMESVAFKRAGLINVPVNSYKGFIGHTLGAAGIIESIFGFESMRNNIIIGTAGCKNRGTIANINVIKQNIHTKVDTVLKTGSGFGGSNAAILFRKYDKQ